MFKESYSEQVLKEMRKLQKKDSAQFDSLRKNIQKVIENPLHNYKFLHHEMKGFQRVHVGSFVLVFKIDEKNEIVLFEAYKHHDEVYE
jgi:YafQ family addiction module toxin component